MYVCMYNPRKLRGVDLYPAATGGPARAHSLNRFWSMFMSYVRAGREADVRMGAGRPRTRRTEGIRRLAPRVQPRARGERPSSYYSSLAGLPYVYKRYRYVIDLERDNKRSVLDSSAEIVGPISATVYASRHIMANHLGSPTLTASIATTPTYSPPADTTDTNSDDDSDDSGAAIDRDVRAIR